MADGLANAIVNTLLNDFAAVATNVQLHTGAPGAAGTSNVSSVTTRPAITWASASAGVLASTGTAPLWASWAGTNGEVVSDISYWNAGSGGTFQGSVQLSVSATMATGDSLTLSAASVTIPVAS